jgi:WD40 repeat protein
MKKTIILTLAFLLSSLVSVAQDWELTQAYTAISDYDIFNKHTISFSKDSKYLAFCSRKGEVIMMDMNTGEKTIVSLPSQVDATVCQFHPSNSILLLGLGSGAVVIYDYAAKTVTREIRAHDKPILYIAISGDGGTFYTSAKDNLIKSWYLSGNSIKTFTAMADAQTLHVVGNKLYYSTSKLMNGIGILDVSFGADMGKLNNKVGKCMDVSADGAYAAIVGMYKEVQIWNLTNKALESSLHGHTKSDGMDVKFSKDGSLLVTSNGDKTVILWDVKNKKMAKQLSLTDYSETLSFSGDGKWLAVITKDYKVLVYSVKKK